MFKICFLMVIFAGAVWAQNIDISNAEYFWDTDPGIGNGTAISLTDVNTDSAFATFDAPAGALTPGMHKLYVRYLDSEGVWSRAEGRYVYIFGPITTDYLPLAITQAEYYFDNLPPVTVDVADDDSVSLTELVSTAGLGPGMHRLFIRYQDERGVRSGAEGKYLYIFVSWTSDYLPLVVTHVEYYFDNLPPVVIDVADAETVTLEELVGTADLGFGIHRFYVRYRDNRNITGGAEGRYGYIVTPQPSPFVANHLVGGEYWVNTDPGIGNATPFGNADDGTWDEGEEFTTFQITGFPLGPTYIGVRFYDAFGVWTPTIQDTVIAGPVLVIRRSGNNIVLDWIPGHETEGRPFHVWRADQVAGPFTEVDTTSNVTWADSNAVNNAARNFYYIRQTQPPENP